MPKPKPKQNNDMNDWIASLAKQSAGEANNNKTHHLSTLTKEQRKQKRADKKALKQQNRKRPHSETSATATSEAISSAKAEQSRRRLRQLVRRLQTIQSEQEEEVRFPRPFQTDRVLSQRKRPKKPLNENTVQPRTSDYSGIGLARETLFLSFLDPGHIPKLEEEFKEHIPGFFGKQRTKAMKRQLDGDMLWRKLANQKNAPAAIPKKFKHLSPDERVQAMIDANMI